MLRIPRLKVEYQLTRSMFVRYVGQYQALHTDSLRDDSRTNAPVLICSGSKCSRTAIVNNNSFRSDVLFSYQPVPGTVFFFGYGATQTETLPLRFDGLERRSDGFFIKASYLYRL
jgi:hypothetical protein